MVPNSTGDRASGLSRGGSSPASMGSGAIEPDGGVVMLDNRYVAVVQDDA
jgi:hypothetical protein